MFRVVVTDDFCWVSPTTNDWFHVPRSRRRLDLHVGTERQTIIMWFPPSGAGDWISECGSKALGWYESKFQMPCLLTVSCVIWIVEKESRPMDVYEKPKDNEGDREKCVFSCYWQVSVSYIQRKEGLWSERECLTDQECLSPCNCQVRKSNFKNLYFPATSKWV